MGILLPDVNPDETGINSFTDQSNGTFRPTDAAAAVRSARGRDEVPPYDADEIAEQSLDFSNQHDDIAYVCASCEAVIDASEWHPVVARSDGAPTVFLFCGASCRREWLGHGGADE